MTCLENRVFNRHEGYFIYDEYGEDEYRWQKSCDYDGDDSSSFNDGYGYGGYGYDDDYDDDDDDYDDYDDGYYGNN